MLPLFVTLALIDPQAQTFRGVLIGLPLLGHLELPGVLPDLWTISAAFAIRLITALVLILNGGLILVVTATLGPMTALTIATLLAAILLTVDLDLVSILNRTRVAAKAFTLHGLELLIGRLLTLRGTTAILLVATTSAIGVVVALAATTLVIALLLTALLAIARLSPTALPTRVAAIAAIVPGRMRRSRSRGRYRINGQAAI